jgi:ABC-2 type transport system ATP-binding protein
MLTATGLVKRYGTHLAVDGVSLEAKSGEILGLLGPNGAGKSTTVGLLAGLMVADAGTVRIGGAGASPDPGALKRRIGLVPQDLALYETLGARDNLQHFGSLYGLRGPLLRQRCQAALELVGLADRASDRVDTFSGGMKRRLNIACALVHDPEVLLLDEPTAGVDPQSRNAIFDNLEALKRAGKALIYTTHYMEEAERLADRIVIIDHGKVVASGALAELVRLLPAAQTLQIDIEGMLDAAVIEALPGVKQVHLEGDRLSVGLDDLTRGAQAVLQAVAAAGVGVRHLSSGRANLEDVFLALTGRQLRD